MEPIPALRSFLIACGSLLAMDPARAADGTWNANSAGNWTDDTKWFGTTIANGADFTATFGDFISLDRIVTLNGDRTIGNITAADTTHNYTLTGSILTLDRTLGVPLINVVGGRTLFLSSQVSGNDGLEKSGAGTLTLSSPANNYTGATLVSGGTLTVGGTLNGTTGTALAFGGTGTFHVQEAAGVSQGMGALTLSSGDGTVASTWNNGAGFSDTTLTFASLAARGAGATGNFTLAGTGSTAANNRIILLSTANAPLATTSNDPGFFFGGAEYARYDAGDYFRATIYGTDSNALASVATGATLGVNDATQDVKITGAITAQTTASVNTINLGANAFTIAAANTLSVNGLLSTGSLTFGAAANQGAIQSTAAGGEIVVRANAGTLTFNSVIRNFGAGATASGLTKSGAGSLTLNATNTYTGDTAINGGTLTVGSNNTAATLGLTAYAGNIFIAGGASLVLDNSTSQNFSGNISGDGTLRKSGSGTLTLSGNNTYTGKTTISAAGAGGPTLSISSLNSVNGGTPLLSSSSLGAPTTVANGTIDLGSGSNVRACALIYTGAGETTDRVMNVSFNSGAKQTIQADTTGGGLLKFTSAFSIIPSSGSTTGGLTLRGSGNGEIAGGIGTIPGILEKADAGKWIIGGASSSNTLTVTGGGLSLQKQVSLFSNTQTSWTPAKITVASGTTLALGVGDSASGYFDATAVNTFLDGSHMGSSTATTGFKSGALLGFDTTHATAGTFTHGGVIGNLGGAASTGVAKLGPGTLVLDQANTYTGATAIDQGTLTFTTTNPSLTGGLVFGLSAGGANTGTLDLTAASASFAGGLNIQTNSAGNNLITLGAGQTLTFSGSALTNVLTVGTATAGGVAKLQVTGTGGTLTVNESTHNIVVANTDTTGPGASAQLDLSDLGTFNATIANLYVGRPTTAAGAATNGRPLTDTLTLAGANTITASGVIAVGGTTNSFGAQQALVKLGPANALNAGSFVVGSARTPGTMDFKAGLTNPSVTLRGAAGGSTRTDITLGDGGNTRSVSNGAGGSSTTLGRMDFTGGSVNAMIGSLSVGYGAATASNLRGEGNGLFIMDGASSHVDVNTLVIAQTTNDAAATSSDITGIASKGTFIMQNGTLVVNTAATLANDIDTSNTANSQQGLSATFNLQGGTATIGSSVTPVHLILGNHIAAGNAGLSTASVNLTGGAFNMFGDIKEGTLGNGTITSSLTLDGATLDMKGRSIGISGALIDTLTFASGTLKNVSGINNTGALTKTTGGTLVMDGANTYPGPTAVNDGKLLANGIHTGGGVISVSATATLGGGGEVGNVEFWTAGTLAPGRADPGDNWLQVADLTLGDAATRLHFELGNPDNGLASLPENDLVLAANIPYLRGVLNVTPLAGFATAPAGSKWRLFDNAGGGAPGAHEITLGAGVGAGYTLQAYEGDNSVYLVAVPEAATSGLVFLGLLLLLRRRLPNGSRPRAQS